MVLLMQLGLSRWISGDVAAQVTLPAAIAQSLLYSIVLLIDTRIARSLSFQTFRSAHRRRIEARAWMSALLVCIMIVLIWPRGLAWVLRHPWDIVSLVLTWLICGCVYSYWNTY